MSNQICTEAAFSLLRKQAADAKAAYKEARKALRKATKATIWALLAEKRYAPDDNFDEADPRYVDAEGEPLPVRPLRKDVVLDDEWGCPSNVTGCCAYDDANDECHDTCLFCGKPTERK